MIGFLVSVSSAAAQGNGNGNGNDPSRSPPDYFPYPPGVIPTDIESETERVRREIRGIEQKTLAEAAALGPLMPTSPSQELAGNGLRAVEVLGKLINYDENLSVFKNVACSSCHMPYAGFSGQYRR